ncbi:MAG: M23 family metallopeptidase [Chloroflexi bacterium]|nr:M23 family metallopeptidase [Chloroflexota bacterium]
MKLHWAASRWLLIVLTVALTLPHVVRADDPLAEQAERFILPWATGDQYSITWGPDDHWASNANLGFAVDFALPEGTPLYAPADGEAIYLVDTRPSLYGLGNYIDLTCGDWKIRMAHLRDAITETRQVTQGEFLGYSGTSGAHEPHLHLELYVRRDGSWSAAQASDLISFFGIPLENLAEGTVVTNEKPFSKVTWAATPAISMINVKFARSIALTLPLRNNEASPLQLKLIQVFLVDPDGKLRQVNYSGDWLIAADDTCTVNLDYLPDKAGAWTIQQFSLVSEQSVSKLPAALSWQVAPSPVAIVGVSSAAVSEMGAHASLELWLINNSDTDLAYQQLRLVGTQPDGAEWYAATDPVLLAAHQLTCLYLETSAVTQVGEWKLEHLDGVTDVGEVSLGTIEHSFTVEGAQLVVENIGIRQNKMIYITLRNIGSSTANADWFEVLLQNQNNDTLSSVVAGPILSLAPGKSITLPIPLPADTPANYRCISGGYWLEGQYYPVIL